MFGADDDDKTTTETATTSSEPDTSCDTAIANNPAPATEKDFDINEIATDEEGHKVNGFLFYVCSVIFLFSLRLLLVFCVYLRRKSFP